MDSNSYEYFSSHNKHNKNRSPSTKKKPTPSTKAGRLANRQLAPSRINKLVRRHHKTAFDGKQIVVLQNECLYLYLYLQLYLCVIFTVQLITLI